MPSRHLLTIQDLSCVGQCSITVALPILSAYGFETSVLPTAVFSNHTAFPRWTSEDQSTLGQSILSVWQSMDIRFDGFLLGYLGSSAAIRLAKSCLSDFCNPGAPIVMDPAFGDCGRIYPPFDQTYIRALRSLLAEADIVLPNWTEVCYLTGDTYLENPTETEQQERLFQLASMTSGTVILTGMEKNGQVGERIVQNGSIIDVMSPLIPGHYYGTGDVFASVFTAVYLRTQDIVRACREASAFVAESIRATEPGHTFGVRFESVLAEKKFLI